MLARLAAASCACLQVHLPGYRLVARAVEGLSQAQARSMGMKTAGVVDLRSDTVTRPSKEMRDIMAKAEVGDDVYGEDPTVLLLQRNVAKLLGKEDALFVPSGTMGNVVSILSKCGRGEQAIVGATTHVNLWEQGGLAALGGCNVRMIQEDKDGTMPLDLIEKCVMPFDDHVCVTTVVCLENSHSGFGGVAVPHTYTDSVGDMCRSRGLWLHVDGARLLNASVALGTPPARLVAAANSVSVCLSKGLGAPVGSVVAGSSEMITRARRMRKVLGGGMRQIGMMAAAGLYALEHYQETIQADHLRAHVFAQALRDVPGVDVEDVAGARTNMVIFAVKTNISISSTEFCDRLSERGVLLWPYGGAVTRRLRAVFHKDVCDEGLEHAIKAVAHALMRADHGMR